MFCTNCGRETRPRKATCTHCGFDLASVIALLGEPEDAAAETDGETRTAREVAQRALALAAVISCAYGAKKPAVMQWLKKEKLWTEATPAERKFLLQATSAKAKIAFTWKIEALVPLLWAMNRIDKMPGIARQCDPESLKHAVVWPPHPTREYVSSCALRSEDEISMEYEKVYRAHWRVRDAQARGKPVPRTLDAEVVQERHHGFNWLTGYMGQSWDDITTDT